MSEPKSFDVRNQVLEAETRIRAHIRETPLDYSPYLSRVGGCRVYLKLENLQITGSFKLRGAMNKFLSLTPEQRRRHLVTASSGNHGMAFGYVLGKFRASGTVYLPENASPAKVEALREIGTELAFHGDDSVKSEKLARETAEKNHYIYVSPYNDLDIVAGQGTIGVELARQLDRIDAVLVPVGGGGLISGIAGYLKSERPGVAIIGCQPVASAVMYESVRAGKLLDLESKPTLSDGSAGGIEPGSVTFDLCRELVDDYILVEEDEIKESIKLLLDKHHMLAEGSGVLSLAAFLKAKERFDGKDVVLVVSGSKISLEKLREVLYSGPS